MAEPTTALVPTNFQEWTQLAEYVAKSDMVPKEFQGKPGNVLVAMQMGASVGLSPFQAVQSIAVINGRPSMWGDAVLAVVMSSPHYDDVDETFDEETMTATCTAVRKGKKKPVVRSFSLAQAKAAQVYDNGKMVPLADKPIWKAYPQRMLQMRARAWALRDAFPDVLKGIQVAEEVRDYDEGPAVGAEEARTVGASSTAETPDPMRPRRRGKPPAGDQAGTTTAPAAEASAPAAEVVQPGEQQAPPAATPTPAPPPAPAPAPEPPKPATLVYTIGAQRFETKGITRAQMMSTFKLVPEVDRKHGQDYAHKSILQKEFGVEHRVDLDEERAGQFIIRLQEVLGRV